MTTNKIDLTSLASLTSRMNVEKMKELLKDYQPIEKLSEEALHKFLKDSKPLKERLNDIYLKLLKDNPQILDNTGSVMANVMANHAYNRQLPYILLRKYLNK